LPPRILFHLLPKKSSSRIQKMDFIFKSRALAYT
jgi:hypothetical protein